MSDTIGRATYSPEDNKLRLYPDARLAPDVYDRVKGAGFIWAPKQQLFVAPAWSCNREDLLLELCGDIEDEDTSIVERAEQRSDRFREYSRARAEDSAAAHKAVESITGMIPLGQPILVGHHSEKRARRDAGRIQSGMENAVRMWDQSQYWKERAAGAIHAAKYKEIPSVRARRIKKIEAELRRDERTLADAERELRFWTGKMTLTNKETGEKRPLEIIHENRDIIRRYLGGSSFHVSFKFPLDKYPRTNPAASKYEGEMSCWSALGGGEPDPDAAAFITVEQAKERMLAMLAGHIGRTQRWIVHHLNRLTYERAMLAESGGLASDKTGPEKGGACRCWASRTGGWSLIQKVNKVSVTVLDNWGNGGAHFPRTMPLDKLSKVMSKAEVEQARSEGRITGEDERGFILLDVAPAPAPNVPVVTPEKKQEQAAVEGLRATLKAGVTGIGVHQLFPTPNAVAKQMIALLPGTGTVGARILEPSAGNGMLIQAVHDSVPADCCRVVAVEINLGLVVSLKVRCKKTLYANDSNFSIIHGDFLKQRVEDLGFFTVILMNPPFDHGSDIDHINHARTFLKQGGTLVAVCAAGPKQREAFANCEWHDLPEGTFKEQGTNVSTAIVVIRKAVCL